MAHELTIEEIEFYANEAKSAGNPRIFLERLSGRPETGSGALHFRWHYRGISNYFGFLLFHWHLCEKVKELGLPVTPLTENDFSQGGRYFTPLVDWNRMRPRISPARSLDDLAVFSQYFQSWHNQVHGILSSVSGLPMGQAETNVLYELFWNFHFFVNNLFEWQLKNYAESNGLASSIPQIVQQIESQDQSIVGAI